MTATASKRISEEPSEAVTPKRMRKRRLLLRNVPNELLVHLHPSYRTIVQRGTYRKRRAYSRSKPKVCVVNPDIAFVSRIRRKYRNAQPKPRVFPWYCEVCTLSTRYLTILFDHCCRQKSASSHVQDFANEQRIAQLGVRSRAKDSLAVMERLPNPQHVELTSTIYVKDSDVRKSYNRVPPLADLCLARLAIEEPIDGVDADDVLMDKGPEVRSSRCLEHASTSFFCYACRRQFVDFASFDDHVKNKDCTVVDTVPDHIAVDTTEAVDTISSFSLGRRHRPCKRDVSHVRCTSCKAGNFESTAALFSHMIKCAVVQCQSNNSPQQSVSPEPLPRLAPRPPQPAENGNKVSTVKNGRGTPSQTVQKTKK